MAKLSLCERGERLDNKTVKCPKCGHGRICDVPKDYELTTVKKYNRAIPFIELKCNKCHHRVIVHFENSQIGR